MNLVNTPPAHGSMLGRGEDRGSSSSVTGRSAGLTTVYVTPVPARAVEAYYQSTYPEYHLSEDCCATAQQADLVGSSSAATIGISITTGQPKIDAHFKIKLSAAPTGANTYVTIYLSGKTS